MRIACPVHPMPIALYHNVRLIFTDSLGNWWCIHNMFGNVRSPNWVTKDPDAVPFSRPVNWKSFTNCKLIVNRLVNLFSLSSCASLTHWYGYSLLFGSESAEDAGFLSCFMNGNQVILLILLGAIDIYYAIFYIQIECRTCLGTHFPSDWLQDDDQRQWNTSNFLIGWSCLSDLSSSCVIISSGIGACQGKKEMLLVKLLVIAVKFSTLL